jgi:hypothetical protein
MDPYLEQFWGDVHASMIVYAREQLQELLPSELVARVQERVSIETPRGRARSSYPDIRVVERSHRAAHRKTEAAIPPVDSGGLLVAKPIRISLAVETFPQGYIEIVERRVKGKVVTLVEVISPSNKLPGKDRIEFRKKQKRCQQSGVNLVEIDLLRRGKWVLSTPRDEILPEERGLYGVGVVRADDDGPYGEYYAIRLDQPLPPINIPLRRTDADIVLQLQPLFNRCYDIGRYRELVDYNVDPVPPLDGDDAEWADAHLKKVGHRRQVKATKKKSASNGKHSKRGKK